MSEQNTIIRARPITPVICDVMCQKKKGTKYLMSKNQKKAYWSMIIGFFISATVMIYPQGAFDNLTSAGSAILTFAYLLICFLIYRYIRANPEMVDKWFQE